MKRSNLITLLAACIFIAAGLNNLSGQDVSGWRGDNRDGTVKGFNAPDKWPDKLNQEWQVQVGEGDASPVLLNNRIYVFTKADSKETVICLEAANGKEVWRTPVNAAPEIAGPAAGHPGPRSTPFVTSEKLFVLGAGGVFSCLDTKTGKILWQNDKYTEVPQFYTSCSPLVIDDICVVQLGGKDNGVVVGFNPDSGKEIWKLQGIPCTYSSPIYTNTSGGMILVQSETDLLGVSLKGELLWKIATPVERRSYNAPTPVYSNESVIVAGQGSGTKAFTLTKSGSKWTSNDLWSNSELGTSFNTPVIKNGFLYANEARLGKLFCLDLKTGLKSWEDETTLNRFASILDLGEVLVSLPANGRLIVFEPNEKAYTELKQYKIAETEVYAHPVFTGNNIIVKDKEMLTSWLVK